MTVSVKEGTELVAVLSPDGRKIAILLLEQVFLVDRQGGLAVPLTDPVTDPDQYSDVAWAPNSRQVVVKGWTELSVIDVVTRESRLVSRRGDLRNPIWTPDGRSILVATSVGDSAVLWMYPVDGRRGAVRLGAVAGSTDPYWWFADYVTYSPDRRSLALADPVRELDLGTWAIRPLADSSIVGTRPRYSPDGRWVAFLSERSGSRQLWVTSRQGGDARPVTRDAADVYDAPLSWTPDSRMVLYTAAGTMHLAPVDGGPEETIPFTAEFQVLRLNGLRRPEIPEPGTRKVARGILHPELSPDGKRVLFAALGDLWVAGVDDSEPRRLTHTPWTDEAGPRWSPDGTRNAYVTGVYGHNRELRVRAVDGPARDRRVPGVPMDQGHSDPGDRVWSPDGRRLAYLATGRVGWVDLENGTTHQVAPAPPGSRAVTIVGWTGHGDSIVFSATESTTDTLASLYPGTYNATRLLRASASDSSRIEEWKLPGEYAVRGAWTPDLSRAAYVAANTGFHVRVGDGSAPVRIQDPAPRFFSWSADGRRLLYLSGSAIRLLDVATGVARTLRIAPQYEVAPAPAPLLLRNVRIIDGRGTAPTALSDLLVAGSRIREITPAGRAQVPAGTQVIDGAGRTLLPGLFDMHQHLATQPPGQVFVYHGILALRDVGNITAEWAQAHRERGEAGEGLSPRVFFSGGFFANDRGGHTPYSVRPVSAGDPASIRDELWSLAAIGADVVKLYGTDPPGSARTTKAAHAMGLPVTSHFLHSGTLAQGQGGEGTCWGVLPELYGDLSRRPALPRPCRGHLCHRDAAEFATHIPAGPLSTLSAR